jgi:hypothetical protein
MSVSQIKIYIDLSKSYYYPGETLSGSVYLDVLEEVNCNKMLLVAKGKQIIKASQNLSIDSGNSTSEEEENSENVSKDNSKDIKSIFSSDNEGKNKSKNNDLSVNNSKDIFKYKKVIHISENDYLSQGKYTFPFDLELPDDLPGSFLFLENNIWIEFIYIIKVKLNNMTEKLCIPFIVRQNQNKFNYPKSCEYKKNIDGCCCEVIEAKIKMNVNEECILNENEIKININLNNSKCKLKGSPLLIEIYQDLVLTPFIFDNKISTNKIVGKYIDKNPIEPKKDYDLNITIPLETSYYKLENLSKTKSVKYYKDKKILSLLEQSIYSEHLSCRYEIFAESKYENVSFDVLGAFLPVLIYPPEKGVFPKLDENIIQSFDKSLINKKIYLNYKSNDYDPDFEKNKKITPEDKDKDSKSSISKSNIKSESNDKSENTKSIGSANNKNSRKPNQLNSIKDNESKKLSFESSSERILQNSCESKCNTIKKKFNKNFLNDALDDVILETENKK